MVQASPEKYTKAECPLITAIQAEHEMVKRGITVVDDTIVDEASPFGGPHDSKAINWANYRGYKVVAWRKFISGDLIIPESGGPPGSWSEPALKITEASNTAGSFRYIVTKNEKESFVVCCPLDIHNVVAVKDNRNVAIEFAEKLSRSYPGKKVFMATVTDEFVAEHTLAVKHKPVGGLTAGTTGEHK